MRLTTLFAVLVPGTGLSKPTQAYCPYCGHTDDPSDFLTDEQKEYMLSVLGNQVMAAAVQQLKKHEFNTFQREARLVSASV